MVYIIPDNEFYTGVKSVSSKFLLFFWTVLILYTRKN
jgi:hypothetical protein